MLIGIIVQDLSCVRLLVNLCLSLLVFYFRNMSIVCSAGADKNISHSYTSLFQLLCNTFLHTAAVSSVTSCFFCSAFSFIKSEADFLLLLPGNSCCSYSVYCILPLRAPIKWSLFDTGIWKSKLQSMTDKQTRNTAQHSIYNLSI